LPDLEGSIINLQQVLINQAERDFPIIMPGYTHFQPAQPILLSHWWMSHFWPLNRDRQRLGDLKKRTSVLPLGSSALSGNPFNIDQEFLTELLGFRVPAQNSLDAVSDRDFAVEFLFIASLIMVHLSKLSESLILFTNPSLAFFELPDAYATGSSIMPQKKNPDLFELTRGKCGTIIGNLTGLLATLKGLPSAYDKDLQEDKSPVFTTFDVIVLTLKVLSKAIAEIIPIKENIEVALKTELFATDIADYMVRLGIPFREAHTLTGKLVQSSIHTGLSLDHMPLDKFKEVSPLIKNDVFEVFNLQRSVSNRQSIGGTAPQSVKRQISNAKEELSIIYT
jgi:argininosuccinate lyase